MPSYTRTFWTFSVLIALLLSSCATEPAPPASPSPSPSASAAVASSAPVASPSTVWTFPAGSRIAGVDVGGQTVEQAQTLVDAVFEQPRPRTLDLTSDVISQTTTLSIPSLVREPDVAELVAQAEQQAQSGQPVAIAGELQVDVDALRTKLTEIAPQFEQAAARELLTDTESLTATFTFRARPAIELDIDATAERIAALLGEPEPPLTETVVLSATGIERPPLSELERVLNEHLKYWKGIGAIYVRDLETGETLGINDRTVFSGASVMKVPIMIYVYARLGALNQQQHKWMEGMLLKSDNLDANALLAAAAGGEGTEMALKGVNEMTEMLAGLGLKHTYQLIPYESGEWLIQQSRLPKGGPKREGEPPFTAPDPYVRTTPREMGELFTMLAECAAGSGALIEKYGDKLNEALCDEMMAWLERPHDQERMVAGIPAGVPVAHKGGWIDDMQSDVGIVSSPNGRYVAAIYIFRPNGYVTNIHATPSPYLADFSHTIYTFFNPEPLE